MKIVEALKDENIFDIRISHGNKWIVYDSGVGFTVYEHKYRQRGSRAIIDTFDEDEAIKALLKE